MLHLFTLSRGRDMVAALFPLAIDLLRGQMFQAKSLVISTVFAVVAFGSTIGWFATPRRTA